MDEKRVAAPPLDGPLAEAVEVIRQLIALCTRYGLKLEALSIASGVPLPPKRKRGRPKVKDERYQRYLAAAFEATALEGDKHGAGARLAKVLAEAEIDPKSPARRSEVKKRALVRQNDLSNLPPETRAKMAYYMRCANAGEFVEKAEARLVAAMDGDDDAARECAEIIRDLLLDVSHKKSRK